MKEQFVTYEIALALKELGFDENCLAYYNPVVDLTMSKPMLKSLDNDLIKFREVTHPCIKAPLWQQVIDWFREKHDILIELKYRKDTLGWNGYNMCYFIIYKGLNDYDSRGKFKNTFYSTERLMKKEAILKAIELCTVAVG